MEQYKNLLHLLETGKLKVVNQIDNQWTINIDVKKNILKIFKNTKIINMPGGFKDKELLTTRTSFANNNIRVVPGGTSIRPGTYIGHNVVIMPPSYINIGAYINDNSMIDSHVLIGSCSYIGKNVHISAAVQIGGVLEPIGERPVIIEDNCFIGAGAILTEGILVHTNAVIAPGVILSASVPIYDIINEKIYKSEIPQNAVVVPGTRSINKNKYCKINNLNIGCAIIIKYRDNKTDKSILLEKNLR